MADMLNSNSSVLTMLKFWISSWRWVSWPVLKVGLGSKGELSGAEATAGYKTTTSMLRQLLIQTVSFLCREKILIFSGDKIPGDAGGV